MQSAQPSVPSALPWSTETSTLLQQLECKAENGLTSAEARRRRRRFGPNRLQQRKERAVWKILLDQFASLIIGLLLAATALSFLMGEWVEGTAIAGVILINAAIGFITELRAVRSMEALFRLGAVTSRVRRDVEVKEVPAEELVPGDIVILEGGDLVSADLRILESSRLQADESMLTGESVPVEKSRENLPEDTPLSQRSNILFKGTVLTRGTCTAVVTATGMNTELGQISALVEEAEAESTPLEKRLDQLGQKLIWVTLFISSLVAVMGIAGGKEVFRMVETGIALAVATIPEGLPIVATLALARGMWRMAQHNALITRLSAVETLGATNIICTDKTGTLTENRITVNRLEVPGDSLEFKKDSLQAGHDQHLREKFQQKRHSRLLDALEAGMLCNNAHLKKNSEEFKGVGDPLEVALLVAGARAGIDRDTLLSEKPRVHEVAFDPDNRMMATYHRLGDGFLVVVKGAPEAVLQHSASLTGNGDSTPLSDKLRTQWLDRNREMGKDGLRVLALARRKVSNQEEEPYRDLEFLGLVGMFDPPRQDVQPAIESCHRAGVRVVMVTGDQPLTAQNVAASVGLSKTEKGKMVEGERLKPAEELSPEEKAQLLQASIFARVSPRQKLDLIALHQENGSIVAMTGDGVNDAPALKKADIGIAMGRRGTQVAQQAADMILRDDAFGTIVFAVEQGRIIFENIRKFVFFLLSCNISEVLVVGLASLVNAPLPILPLQILFLNMVTDVFPALALGAGEGNPGIMKRPPRDPSEPILARRHWHGIGFYGSLITAGVLSAFALAHLYLQVDASQAVTISFLTLALAQLWHVFNMRDSESRVLNNEITRNRYVWGALLLCLALLGLAVYLPGFARLLELTPPGPEGWILIIVFSLLPLLLGQLLIAAGWKYPSGWSMAKQRTHATPLRHDDFENRSSSKGGIQKQP